MSYQDDSVETIDSDAAALTVADAPKSQTAQTNTVRNTSGIDNRLLHTLGERRRTPLVVASDRP